MECVLYVNIQSMDTINSYVNSQLLNCVKINNRNVVAAICINELNTLHEHTTDSADMLMLEQLINYLSQQIDREIL